MSTKKPTSLSSSSSSDSETEAFNPDQIPLNRYLFQAYHFHLSEDLPTSKENYLQALSLLESKKEIKKMAFVKLNIGMIDFLNGDLKSSIKWIEDSLMLVNSYPKIFELKLFLVGKILGALVILHLITNDWEKTVEYFQNLVVFIENLKGQRRSDVLQSILFQMFRFSGFGGVKDADFERIEDLYQGVPLACLYSSMGLIQEMNENYPEALSLQLKALETWKNESEIGFVLLSLKHIISLAPKVNLNVVDIANFRKIYDKVLSSEEFNGINMDALFKNYEKKMNLAKMFTQKLSKMEVETSLLMQNESKNNSSTIQSNCNSGKEPFWKQALRIRLMRAIVLANETIDKNSQNKEEINLIKEGVDQLKTMVNLLKNEKDELVLNKLRGLIYTKDAVSTLRSALNNLKKEFYNKYLGNAWRKILLVSNKKLQRLSYIKRKSQITPIISKAYFEASQGDYIVKCNRNTNGRKKKFFKLEKMGILLFALKENQIENYKKNKQINLSSCRGLLYGKITGTMLKSGNKSLEPHLCFSLLMGDRSFDLYCSPEQISYWYIALSKEVKKFNPKAFVIQPGVFLWRKMKSICLAKMMERKSVMKEKNNATMSFVKAILYLSKAIF